MNNRKTWLLMPLSVVVCGLLSTKAKAVVDPVTVAIAVNTVTSLFSKKAPDPSIELLKANRELLVGLHGRLDEIEHSIAKILVDVAQLPQEMFEQNLNAQSYNIGKKITAIGKIYLTKLAALEYDKRTFGENSERYKIILYGFEAFLISNIDQITLYSTDLMQRNNSTNINALTVMTAALIELAMRIELEKTFDGSPGDILEGAESYLAHTNQILNSGSAVSLVSLIETIKALLINDPVYRSWRNTMGTEKSAEWTIGKLAGKYQTPICSTRQVLENYTATCTRRVMISSGGCYGPPGDRDCDPAEWGPESYPCTKQHWVNKESKAAFVEIYSKGEISDYPLLGWRVSVARLPKIDLACPTSRNGYKQLNQRLKNIEKDANILIGRANVLSQMQATRDATKVVKDRLRIVREGNFDVISSYQIKAINQIGVLDIMSDINSVDRMENLRDTVAYTAAMEMERKKIEILIADQDERIKAVFEKAANAAKWNRTLGYLRMAASMYRVYHYIDTNLVNNDKDDFIKMTTVIRDGIIEDMGRIPASQGVIGRLDEILELAGVWGGFMNARRQLDAMNTARQTLEWELPIGVEKTYDIVIVGDRFWAYQEVGQPQLRPGLATTHGTLTIRGKKTQK